MHQLIDKKNKIILYILLFLILSTTSQKFEENQNSYSYTINKFNIMGLSDIENLQILKELNSVFYENSIIIEKDKLKKIITKYNIIEEYTAKKVYPSTINIDIKPTNIIARISNDGQLLIGANGKIIKNKKNDDTLPYIFGEFNSKYFLIFKKNIEKSKLSFTEFKTLYFFPSNRWDVLTNDNILIKLPQDNILPSLNLAYKIINSHNFKDKKLIDLRVHNNLITR